MSERMECECCDKAAAFRVKHHETSNHWRCIACFRDITRQGNVIVTGVATKKQFVEHPIGNALTLGMVSRRLGDVHLCTDEPCSVPPDGWKCSRVSGHDGPCAATAVEV